jgi:hypothetical protein
MTGHLHLIVRQLTQLQRMSEYLAHSVERIQPILPITNWPALRLEQHETLAAFRIRFNEFQEHLGKIMQRLPLKKKLR